MPNLKDIKILVVDDDDDVRDSLITYLKKEGYNVAGAKGGFEALEMIRHRLYHIVILDLKMSDIDGLEVLDRIKKSDTNVNVIILTGYPSLESAVETMKIGAVDYLTKPYDINHLRNKIREVAVQKGLVNRDLKDILMSIGHKIRDNRKNQKMTLAQLARVTDLSKGLISQVENGRASPSIASLSKIADALNMRMSEFFD
jgi:two-component system, OmpR family, response regulator